MKKISALFVLLATLVVTGSGCLKDEAFENQENGIQVADVKAVAFPQASASPIVVGITGQSAPLAIAGPLITVESQSPASDAITVGLAIDQTAIIADSLTPLPEGTFSLSTTQVTVPKDSSFIDNLTITVLNSDQLDPNISYGIGIKIVSADKGYAVASNMSTVVIALNIKNKYDGIYTVVSGKVTRYSAPGAPLGDALSGPLAGNADVILATAGPNSVLIPIPGEEGALQWAKGQNSDVAGIDGLLIVVDPVTNLTTITSELNPTLANWEGKENKYDPETQTFYLGFKWNPAANVREYEIVLKYKGPRP